MFRTTPLDLVLKWPLPNYDHPETRGPEIWWISGIFLCAATFCVAVRLYTRIFVRRWFGIDDVLVILGFICSVALTALVAVGVHSQNWDRHLWDVRPSMYEGSVKTLYFSRIAWGLAASFTRLSVLSLYYRLLNACEAPRSFYFVNHAATGATTILLLYFLFTGIFPCRPIYAYWAWPTPENASCFDDGLSFEVSAIINTTLEAIVATLPLIAIFLLRVDQKQRLAVVGVLSLGYFVCLAGIFRTIYIFKVVQTFDLSWWAAPQWICSEVENDIALICACAAPLRPVLSRLISRLRGVPVLLPKFSQRTRLLSIQTSTSKAPTCVEHGISSAADWTTAMSKTVDLEGIANDGFGYTVHISGPTKAEKKRAALKQMKTNLEKNGLVKFLDADVRRTEGMELAEKRKGHFDVQVQQEVDVQTSIQPERRGSRFAWGSTPAERVTQNIDRSDSISKLFPQVQAWDLNDVDVELGRVPASGQPSASRDSTSTEISFTALPIKPGRKQR